MNRAAVAIVGARVWRESSRGGRRCESLGLGGGDGHENLGEFRGERERDGEFDRVASGGGTAKLLRVPGSKWEAGFMAPCNTSSRKTGICRILTEYSPV